MRLLPLTLLLIAVPTLAQADDDKMRRLHDNARNCLSTQFNLRAEDPKCYSTWIIRKEVWDKACAGPINIYFNYRRDVAKNDPETVSASRADWLQYWNDYIDRETYNIQQRNGCI
ncbi:hypothetical protein [Pararhizobium sp. DWP3-4]|uniref:hypothetical protein n=1 Tax=Pararhizobium sp. DWP3-4 TaxID=2804565 RepID=UPI003CF33533